MSRIILIFGIAAGVIVAVPMCLMVANSEHGSAAQSYFAGYLVAGAALSLIFVRREAPARSRAWRRDPFRSCLAGEVLASTP
jgi:hypothetical protein